LTSGAAWPRISVMFRARRGGLGLGLGGPEAGRGGTRHPMVTPGEGGDPVDDYDTSSAEVASS